MDTYGKWIEYQMTPEMNWRNIEIDDLRPISSFDISKNEQLGEAFNWKKTQPLSKLDHQQKGTKLNFLDFKLQINKCYHFIKVNKKGPDQNIF